MVIRRISALFLVLSAGLVLALTLGSSRAIAAGPTTIDLGTATGFAVVAGSTVTNTGSSTISGHVGVSPGLAIVGFPPATLVAGSKLFSGGTAATVESALATSFNVAGTPVGLSGPVGSPVAVDLAGLNPVPGTYYGSGSPDALSISAGGTLTLDAAGDPNAVWIFQSASTLITGSSSVVSLINGADPCNVFWQVGSSATLGSGSTMVGTVMALTSITATTGASVSGRLLARNGAVTLDTNTITAPAGCATTSSFDSSTGVDTSAQVTAANEAAAAAAAATAAAASAAAATAAASAAASAAELAATGSTSAVTALPLLVVSGTAIALGVILLSQSSRARARRLLRNSVRNNAKR